MKSFLVLLVLILGGALYWALQRPQGPAEHRAVVAELQKELDAAREEIAGLKAARARSDSKFSESPPASQPFSTAPADSASGSGAASPTIGAAAPSPVPQHAKLRAIFDTNAAALAAEMDEAKSRLARFQRDRKEFEDNPPTFNEQTEVFDAEGAFVGRRGVRTSNADRNRAMDKHREDLALFDEKIETVRREISQIESRRRLLDDQYRKARIRAGSGGPERKP